jgi:hypothetical protein
VWTGLADDKETLFFQRVVRVGVDEEAIIIENCTCFLEGDPVLAGVVGCLSGVPLELHKTQYTPWRRSSATPSPPEVESAP